MSLTNKKIGVFTITDAINYGAFYQMYAMAKYFSEQGADVTIYHGSYSFKRKLVKYFSPNIERQIRKAKMLYKFDRDSASLKIKEYKGEKLDYAVLGSDEIWNVENKSFESSRLYYGFGINANKIISYAPSIGYAKEVSFDNHLHFKSDIRNIDDIFVRDSSSKYIASKFTNKEIFEVVDPTVLYDNWFDVVESTHKIEGDYILYYGYTSEPPFKEQLIKFAEMENLRIISCGFTKHEWCDENYTVSPFEFLDVMCRSKYFLTTTFHGTVMASLMNVNFGYFGSGQKIVDFAMKMNLEDRHIDERVLAGQFKEKCLIGHNESRYLINQAKNESREKVKSSLVIRD